MKQVVLATGNSGKVAEMQQTLQDFGFDVLPQSQFAIPEAVEDGLTFVENALKKARHASQLTGLAAIADDSGLEVDALHGAPGIYSARYAASSESDKSDSSANNDKLLTALEGIEQRSARYQCVIVYLEHANDPTPIICQGTWEGNIAQHQAGNNGFGYDPVFYVAEHQCHAAQLSPEQKKQLSHRALALTQLQAKLSISL